MATSNHYEVAHANQANDELPVEFDSLDDAMSLASRNAPADVFAVVAPRSMPAHGDKTIHHWRVSASGKVTQIR